MTDARCKRRTFLAGVAAATTLGAAPAVHAQQKLRWRMVTSWPKNSPGPGVTAQRLADRIAAMSDGRLTIKVYAAGELVPAFPAFDAVAELRPLFRRGREVHVVQVCRPFGPEVTVEH